MKLSVLNKLENLQERYEEIQALLGDPDVASSQERYVSLTKEFSQLENVVKTFAQLKQVQSELSAAKALLTEEDLEIQALAREEIEVATTREQKLEYDLQVLLLPTDPNDANACFLEIRAGTGGDEAAIFAGDLFRMYTRYAEMKGWQIEVLSANEGEHGGFKEIILRIGGQDVFGLLKFESGGHRVQRVPETESQGRIHTSACTVAVMPEIPEAQMPEINPSDLRIDTFRASGAGGQHVNKTESAIRITHLPTGFVVECQEERSQHKNKAKAMRVLASRLVQHEEEKRRLAEQTTRRDLLGSGDRSDRIRTYNYPQGRVTDHRIQLTVYRLNEVVAGHLDCLIEPLKQEYQADQLAALAQES